jgi:hypothetical protein
MFSENPRRGLRDHRNNVFVLRRVPAAALVMTELLGERGGHLQIQVPTYSERSAKYC